MFKLSCCSTSRVESQVWNAVRFKVSVSVTLRVAFLRSWLSNKANTYYDSHLLQRPEAEQYLRECFLKPVIKVY